MNLARLAARGTRTSCSYRLVSGAVSKKLEQKQARRAAEERRKAEARRAAMRRNALTIGSAVLVGALVVIAIAFQRPGEEGDVGVSAEEANCGEVERHADQGRDHIEEGAPHEPYDSSPPTSGPHYAEWADTEFFTEPLPPEQLVHNLEHGEIVIWYSPDAPAEVQGQIEELVDQEPVATVASPYADIEAPYQLVLTAWRHSQACELVSQEVVNNFRREFQGHGPEQIAPPFDG